MKSKVEEDNRAQLAAININGLRRVSCQRKTLKKVQNVKFRLKLDG